MITLSEEDVVLLHAQLIVEIGGSEEVWGEMNIELTLKRYTDVLVWKKA